jgi:hypothetical protein
LRPPTGKYRSVGPDYSTQAVFVESSDAMSGVSVQQAFAACVHADAQ